MTDKVWVGRALLDAASEVEAVESVTRLARARDGARLVVTPNIHHLWLLERDVEFRRAYNRADLVLPDGWPLAMIAQRVLGRKVNRVAGSDLLTPMAQAAAAQGLSMAILGGPGPASAEKAANALRSQAPGLDIALIDPLPRGFDQSQGFIEDLQCRLDSTQPDIIAIGVGAPKQEIFAEKFLLARPSGVVLCVGAGIAFLAGDVRRAPVWMQRLRLEWLFRIFTDPIRLAPRYIRASTVAWSCALRALRRRPQAGELLAESLRDGPVG